MKNKLIVTMALAAAMLTWVSHSTGAPCNGQASGPNPAVTPATCPTCTQTTVNNQTCVMPTPSNPNDNCVGPVPGNVSTTLAYGKCCSGLININGNCYITIGGSCTFCVLSGATGTGSTSGWSVSSPACGG